MTMKKTTTEMLRIRSLHRDCGERCAVVHGRFEPEEVTRCIADCELVKELRAQRAYDSFTIGVVCLLAAAAVWIVTRIGGKR